MAPQNKKIFVIGGIAIAVLVGAALLLSGTFSSQVTLTVAVSPASASITIDGQPAKAGRVTLAKGKHTLKGTQEHFDDATKEFDTATLVDKTVYLVLPANTPEAIAWLRAHPEDYKIREIGVGQQVSEGQKQILQKYPKLSELPHETFEYKVTYVAESNNAVTFYVTLYVSTPTPDNQAKVAWEREEYKKQALNYLQGIGIDTTKEKIVISELE